LHVLSVFLCNKSVQFVTDSVVRNQYDCFAIVVEDYSRLIDMRLARSREEAHTIHAQRRHVRCSTTFLCGCRDVGLNFAKLYQSLEQSQLWSRIDKKDTAVVDTRLFLGGRDAAGMAWS
jgi:hypothetical protein